MGDALLSALLVHMDFGFLGIRIFVFSTEKDQLDAPLLCGMKSTTRVLNSLDIPVWSTTVPTI